MRVTNTTDWPSPLVVVTVDSINVVKGGGREVVAGGLVVDGVGFGAVVFWLGVEGGISVVGGNGVNFEVDTGAFVTVKRLACPSPRRSGIEGHTRGVRHSSRSSAPSDGSRPVSRTLELAVRRWCSG